MNPPLWFSFAITGLVLFMIIFMITTYLKGIIKYFEKFEVKQVDNNG